MKSTFRPTTPIDRAQLSALFSAAFPDAPSGGSLLAPAAMEWKYWIPRADWAEPRGYVLEREGRIVAHAGLWPVTLHGSARRGVQMIDWCSARDAPGAGLALAQKLAGRFDFMYSIGGSEMTRKVLPGLGFVEITQAWTAARPLRPWRQILTHQHLNWKLVPRLVRNWMWSHSPARSADGWKAIILQPSEIPAILFSGDTDAKFCPRPPAFFEYLATCPTVNYQLHGIENEEGLQGYFALGVLRGQARVACLALASPSRNNWRIAYTLAQQVALDQKAANEIVAVGSKGWSAEAARLAGLRHVSFAPVYLLNKKGCFPPPQDFQFQMSDDDAAFLDLGRVSYYT